MIDHNLTLTLLKNRQVRRIVSVCEVCVLLPPINFEYFRFIRYDANEALESFSENCTLWRVISGLQKAGVTHKHVAARTASGRILANICSVLGSTRIMSAFTQKESKETVEFIFKMAAQLMTDGSLDVRQEAKKIFAILMEIEDCEKILKYSVSLEVISKIRKPLDSVLKSLN